MQTAATPAMQVRYIVLLLTVAAYMITYIDRVLLSAAVPSIETEFGFSMITMGWVLSSYQIAYALFQIPGGWLGDKLGARLALTAVVIWWSAFTALTALTWSAASMAVCLFLFGMGEAGAFPIATRSLSRWMLPGERGFAQGATHAGSRLGGALTPLMAVFLITQLGWRAPFFCFAALGVIWALIWFRYYRDTPREHPRVTAAELQRIEQALGNPPVRGAVPWAAILRSPQVWLLSLMYFCYGYDIGMFLSWFPKYLHAARGFNLQQMGLYASLPLLAGFAGDLCGGASSDWLLRRSGNLELARRVVGLSGFLLTAVLIPLACLPARAVDERGLFLRRGVRPGAHGGCFMGNHARPGGRLRRFRLGRHEYLGQSGRCRGRGSHCLPGYAVGWTLRLPGAGGTGVGGRCWCPHSLMHPGS